VSAAVAGPDDPTIARAVVMGAGVQVLAKGVHLALNVVASLVLIRSLGPAAYGDYVFVFSLCALFGLLSDFGITKVAVRDMSRAPAGATPAILGGALATRLTLALAAIGLTQLVLLAIGARPELRTAAAVASLLYVSDALLCLASVFQVRLAMHYDALVTVAAQTLDTALILWLASRQAGLLPFVAAPVVSGFAGAALAALVARLRFRTTLALDLRRLPGLLRDSFPVGMTLLLAVAYLKLDGILLGIMAHPEDVGIYGAAYKPIEYLLLAGAVLVQPMFTLLARWHGHDPRRFTFVYRRGAEALLAYALPVAVVTAFVAEPLVRLLYAPGFGPAAVPMRLLAVAMVFMILSAWQGFALLAGGHQRVALLYDAAGLVVNVALNLVLIRWLGYLGAALAALATSVFVAGCAVFAARHFLGVSLSQPALQRLALANVALAACLWLALRLGWPWPVATALGALAYPVWLLACRVTSLEEVRGLLGHAPSLTSHGQAGQPAVAEAG
jgi:O-antigen/teichoic acid export membrane protein